MRVVGKNLKNDFVQEAVTGTRNGSNVTFSVSTPFVSGTLQLYLNGLEQFSPTHYSVSGTTITMVTAPVVSQDFFATFWRQN